MTELDDLRRKIDVLDGEILKLIKERMQTSVAIGKAKQATGQTVFDAEREYAVFDRLARAAENLTLPAATVQEIYISIIKTSRMLQGAAQLNGAPRLYAVLGHPIGHSVSPVMHNRAFNFMNYNGLYFAVDTTDVNRTVKALKELEFGGASVTMPHKEAVIESLDELRGVALELNTVNTIVNDNGRLIGYNTDSEGAMAALKAVTGITGKKTLLIGAGGAARAVAYGLKAEKADLTIVNRDVKKGEKLAELTGAKAVAFTDVLKHEYDIVINATSVGMSPNVDAMPVEAGILRAGMVVMDIVYNPLQTKLLQTAAAQGCITVNGVAMFVGQGARQFELWTGLSAPIPFMRQTVVACLFAQ